jgi:predicted metalloprotease with PDZ domain
LRRQTILIAAGVYGRHLNREAMQIPIDVRAQARLCMLLLVGLIAPGRIQSQIRLTLSAPVANVRYEITADSAALRSRQLVVTTRFTVHTMRPVLLALPAWSPGHYVLLWFASRVSDFSAVAEGRPLVWRKVDYQTWMIEPDKPGEITITFHYRADAIDRAVAWTAPNFAFFNGTNLFLYPVGRGFDWRAQVSVRTEPAWRVTTPMVSTGAPNEFMASNYHDLVDMPFYVGRFDLDSVRSADRWIRFALYPAGAMTPTRRDRTLGWLAKIVPAHAAVFRDVPFASYTVFVRSDTIVNGGGLEHQSSQVDEVLRSQLDADLSGLYSHEFFHAWNVKRLRPADLVPYRYDDAQQTTWLWVSEGITDYYGTLALSRTGIIDSTQAYAQVAGWIVSTESAPPTALSDASLSAWIPVQDASGGLYYPKGALVGFLLDVMIRDASDNRHSLDDVMRQLYDSTYKRGKGFTPNDWWRAVSRNAAGRLTRDFADFDRRYITGRERLPLDSVLSLAGLRVERLTHHEPRFGLTTATDSGGVRITTIVPGGAAADAGLRVADVFVSVGDVPITNLDSFGQVRARYASTTLSTLPAVVRRGADTLTLPVPVRLVERAETRVVPSTTASDKAVRHRHSIFNQVPR